MTKKEKKMIGEMTMDKVKIMLSSEIFVQLYTELADRRLQAFADADFSRDGDTDVEALNDCKVIVEQTFDVFLGSAKTFEEEITIQRIIHSIQAQMEKL